MDATNQSTLLPREIWGVIANFAVDQSPSIRGAIAAAANLQLVNTFFNLSLDSKFDLLKNERRIELIYKYTAYSDRYYYHNSKNDQTQVHVPSALYDALSSGCEYPFVYHSLDFYDAEVEKDIKDIVRLMPCSLRWNFGSTRCDQRVSPLLIGCLNPNIPPKIIEYILEQGESPYQMRPEGGSCWFGREDTWKFSLLGCAFYEKCESHRKRCQELYPIFERFVGKGAPSRIKLEPCVQAQ